MKAKILLVDDEEILRENIALILRQEGYEVDEASNGEEAYQKYLTNKYDILISDIEMPKMKGIELLERVSKLDPQLISIFITAYGSLETAIAALRLGASDYILKPIDFDELILKINRLLEYRQLMVENQLLRRELQKQYSFDNIIGKSPAMQRVFEMIKSVADTNSSVLITGNSGTGKELVSRAIHYNGPRKDKPFIVVNCGAIPETLIESELFGHKKGSFTGAIRDKEGFFQAANGGTLFLDEISEMPLQSQVRLLRAIEQKEIIPVGSSTPIPVDVRIISATNKDLYKEVEAGRFRSDLYYRLNVVEIHLPSLSERVEDIPLLVEYFVDKYRKEMNKNIKGVDAEAMKALMNYHWKGEVRELENVIERAVIFCKGEYITLNELPPNISHIADNVQGNFSSELKSLDLAVSEFEREYIQKALALNDYDKEKTARMLGVSTATLYRRIKELKILA
ncbi:MAG: sigma-54 dependent transcriptional regulator [Ignavibacteria bacterium]|nr:sigma-54 dependent transcriptional regulator [Ignavibacteria bacterium]